MPNGQEPGPNDIEMTNEGEKEKPTTAREKMDELADEIAPTLPAEISDEQGLAIAERFEPLFEETETEEKGRPVETALTPEFSEAQIARVRKIAAEALPKPRPQDEQFAEIRINKTAALVLKLIKESGLVLSAEPLELDDSIKKGIGATVWDKEKDDSIEGYAQRAAAFAKVTIPSEYNQTIREEILLRRMASRAVEKRFIRSDDWMLVYSTVDTLVARLSATELTSPVEVSIIIQTALADQLNTMYTDSAGKLKPRKSPVLSHSNWSESTTKEQLIIDTIAYHLPAKLPGTKYIENDEAGPSIIKS